MNKVYVVGMDGPMESMYRNRGWELVTSIEDADLVQFTGGADVTPSFYEEEPHPRTYSDSYRDEEEKVLYEECKEKDIPTVGICRGGQFLNVLNGGSMFQDVDGHAISGTHEVIDQRTGNTYQCTSTHHQMMRVGVGGKLVATGGNISSHKEYMFDGSVTSVDPLDDEDVEVVFYPEGRSLCFQPHPEYVGKEHECQEYFFDLLQEKFGFEKENI